jgi:hypothetical protein
MIKATVRAGSALAACLSLCRRGNTNANSCSYPTAVLIVERRAPALEHASPPDGISEAMSLETLIQRLRKTIFFRLARRPKEKIGNLGEGDSVLMFYEIGCSDFAAICDAGSLWHVACPLLTWKNRDA